MAEVIYEYTAYIDATDYNVNPTHLVDLDDDTYGLASAGVGAKIVNFSVNQCDGTDLGTITKVEILTKAHSQNSGDDNFVKANYGGAAVYGDNNDISTVGGVTEEFAFDITTDTNAPSPWAWSDIQDLDIYFNGTVTASGLRVYYGKIRVTYEEAGNTGNFFLFLE